MYRGRPVAIFFLYVMVLPFEPLEFIEVRRSTLKPADGLAVALLLGNSFGIVHNLRVVFVLADKLRLRIFALVELKAYNVVVTPARVAHQRALDGVRQVTEQRWGTDILFAASRHSGNALRNVNTVGLNPHHRGGLSLLRLWRARCRGLICHQVLICLGCVLSNTPTLPFPPPCSSN